MIISLIGYRATGKSTVGRILAERLGWTCVDADEAVQERAGCSIREIFDRDGEPAFRQLETEVILDLVRRHKLVLALGGGAVMTPENRQAIQMAGPVVWLTATPEVIRRRLESDPVSASQRPSLTGRCPTDEIRDVLQQRLATYREASDHEINSGVLSPTEIVAEIIERLQLSPTDSGANG